MAIVAALLMRRYLPVDLQALTGVVFIAILVVGLVGAVFERGRS